MINAIIDISHHNGPMLDFAKAKDDGVIGVLHKATQGSAGSDPMYAANRDKAKAAGLLWGAYHFGTGSDGVRQAENFLAFVGDPTDMLLVLDFEPNPTGATMSLPQAHDFISYIETKTWRYPGFYSSGLIKQLLGASHDPLLNKCWFWLAQYGPVAVVPPTWPTWTMWQYTDGAINPDPKQVAGIGHCDRSRFNGDETHLRKLWGVA